MQKFEKQFLEVRTLIQKSKNKALKSVNTILVDLYWNVGKYVSVKLECSEWGKSVVKELSKYIQKTEPEIKGFSHQNIWRMKQFYEYYEKFPKLSPLVREITWTNNMLILSKSKTEYEKEFYLRLTKHENYSKRELERQIDTCVFERTIGNPEKLTPVARKIFPTVEQKFRDILYAGFSWIAKRTFRKRFTKQYCQQFKRFYPRIRKGFFFCRSRIQSASWQERFLY